MTTARTSRRPARMRPPMLKRTSRVLRFIVAAPCYVRARTTLRAPVSAARASLHTRPVRVGLRRLFPRLVTRPVVPESLHDGRPPGVDRLLAPPGSGAPLPEPANSPAPHVRALVVSRRSY